MTYYLDVSYLNPKQLLMPDYKGTHWYFVGPTGSGKSYLLYWIVQCLAEDFDSGLLFCSSEAYDPFFRYRKDPRAPPSHTQGCWPSVFIYDNFDEEVYMQWLQTCQRETQKNGRPRRSLVVIDDQYTPMRKLCRMPAFEHGMRVGRHAGIHNAICTQWPMDTQLDLRSNYHWTFLARSNKLPYRERCYQQFGSAVEQDEFNYIFNDLTRPEDGRPSFMAIRNSSVIDDLSQLFYIAQAPGDCVRPFKFGSDRYWAAHWATWDPAREGQPSELQRGGQSSTLRRLRLGAPRLQVQRQQRSIVPIDFTKEDDDGDGEDGNQVERE